jgi:hypothetical protein
MDQRSVIGLTRVFWPEIFLKERQGWKRWGKLGEWDSEQDSEDEGEERSSSLLVVATKDGVGAATNSKMGAATNKVRSSPSPSRPQSIATVVYFIYSFP